MAQRKGYKHTEDTRKKMSLGHIDYNKQNNNLINLISLCKNCHIKTNSNRKHWENYFKMKMFIRELFNPQNIINLLGGACVKIKIILEPKDIRKISLEQLCLFVKKLNMNKNIWAHIERCGDFFIEVVIEKRNEFRDLCESLGVMYFEDKEEWKEWMMRRKNERNNFKREH